MTRLHIQVQTLSQSLHLLSIELARQSTDCELQLFELVELLLTLLNHASTFAGHVLVSLRHVAVDAERGFGRPNDRFTTDQILFGIAGFRGVDHDVTAGGIHLAIGTLDVIGQSRAGKRQIARLPVVRLFVANDLVVTVLKLFQLLSALR